MQRTIHKYEQTLSEVDHAVKRPAHSTDQDLRKLISQQTKQICQLQKELTQKKAQKAQTSDLKMREIEEHYEQRLKDLKAANNELI